MRYLFFCTFFLSFVYTVSGQQEKKIEKTVFRFVETVNSKKYSKAQKYVILNAGEDFERAVSRGSSRDEINIQLVSCETTQDDYNASCNCDGFANGRRMFFDFALTEVDGKWYIVDIRDRRGMSDRELNADAVVAKYDYKMNPGEMLREFAMLNGAGKFAKASKYTMMDARTTYLAQSKSNPSLLPVAISNVVCSVSRGTTSALNCSCQTIDGNGDETTVSYTLVPVDGAWRILRFGFSGSPQAVVEQFVTYQAEGFCTEALAMAVGSAAENMQGSIDAGCTPYSTEIISVDCETFDNDAMCTCVEKRDGMEMTFKYDLRNINGQWFVESYQKDLGLDMGDEIIREAGPTDSTEIMSEEIVEISQNAVISEPDTLASFPGGQKALEEFIAGELRYPYAAMKAGIQGTVIVKIMVEADGEIYEVSIDKGIQKAMDDEALRIVFNMPAWKPAYRNGKQVRSVQFVQIDFKL